MSGADWNMHLAEGETILWQGRPDGALTIHTSEISKAAFGIFFTGFSVFWMTMAAKAGGFFWMFGLIFFVTGLGQIAQALAGNAFKRRRTWYTLTDRRAFIATDLPFQGRRLKFYPITSDLSIEYLDDNMPSLFFASETKRKNRGTYQQPVGFERIADAPLVLDHIRNIQQGNA
jgi:hypothetical protein